MVTKYIQYRDSSNSNSVVEDGVVHVVDSLANVQCSGLESQLEKKRVW